MNIKPNKLWFIGWNSKCKWVFVAFKTNLIMIRTKKPLKTVIDCNTMELKELMQFAADKNPFTHILVSRSEVTNYDFIGKIPPDGTKYS